MNYEQVCPYEDCSGSFEFTPPNHTPLYNAFRCHSCNRDIAILWPSRIEGPRLLTREHFATHYRIGEDDIPRRIQ